MYVYVFLYIYIFIYKHKLLQKLRVLSTEKMNVRRQLNQGHSQVICMYVNISINVIYIPYGRPPLIGFGYCILMSSRCCG